MSNSQSSPPKEEVQSEEKCPKCGQIKKKSFKEIFGMTREELASIPYSVYLKVISDYGIVDGEDTKFNFDIGELVARSFIHDVVRMNTYHRIEIPDEHKKAGFITKWIYKLKPVQVFKSVNDVDSEIKNEKVKERTVKQSALLKINAIIAFETGLSMMMLNMGMINDSQLTKHFLYTIMYRETQGETLSLIYYQLEKTIK